jgi:hypothetical protein
MMSYTKCFPDNHVENMSTLTYFRLQRWFKKGLKISKRQSVGNRDRRGRDRMVVGFSAICAISAYHH